MDISLGVEELFRLFFFEKMFVTFLFLLFMTKLKTRKLILKRDKPFPSILWLYLDFYSNWANDINSDITKPYSERSIPVAKKFIMISKIEIDFIKSKPKLHDLFQETPLGF